MIVSRETLLAESSRSSFRPEILEKSIHLLHLLSSFQEHPFIKDKLALKGGTALNLFLYDIPRLSVDIDLNFIGSSDRESMLAERPSMEIAIEAVCKREGFTVDRVPTEHAGGKWRLRYPSALGGQANLEVDLNYMFRVPLWPVVIMDSIVLGNDCARAIPIVSREELIAGKLAALFSRTKARDVFDTVQLLSNNQVPLEIIRLGFVVFGAMNPRDWREISIDDIDLEKNEIERQLIPVLRSGSPQSPSERSEYASKLIETCKEKAAFLFPLRENELEFIRLVRDVKEIRAELLTPDVTFQQKVNFHPLLQWQISKKR